MFDIDKVTLEEIDDEYNLTLDKLERLSKLREAVTAQEHRRVKYLAAEYNIAQFNAKVRKEKKAKEKDLLPKTVVPEVESEI